ncbi:MAG: ABC transporter ATP-binding protein [Porphyromonadaceae bacterium]|nr:ABC transporter ATP-binding protein [Porphyromonadaceae bacterium]
MITAKQISKTLGSLQILKGINLDIHPGEIVSIVGPSGAGKTTLLQILGTLSEADPGSSLSIQGQEVLGLNERAKAKLRNRSIGFVFQSHQLLPEFTALENVMVPALIGGMSKRTAKERAKELLTNLGLIKRQGHKPSEMSGGECQRVAVARAMMNRPTVILADEPSGSLDTHNKEQLHQLFFDLREQLGQTFVIVTHDTELAERADRMIYLKDGRIERIVHNQASQAIQK